MKLLYSAKWADGFRCSADAQKVADEIASIGEEATPQQIVDKARSKDTELHKCFEWDNKMAAEKYRLHQARLVTNHLVFVTQEHKENYEVRVFQKVNPERGYIQTKVIFKNEDMHEQLLKSAYRELSTFTAKYRCLTELEKLFDVINELTKSA